MNSTYPPDGRHEYTHHIVEAMFKAVAQSHGSWQFVVDERIQGVLSTKGTL